jgi:hypothetical protein
MRLHHRLGIIFGSFMTLLLGMAGQAAADETFTYGGHTYVLVTTNQSWTSASQDCWSRNGALVTVGDAAENTFLASKLSDSGINHAWIGLHDQWTEGYFQWISGDSSSYRNWGTGEPNDTSPGEDFVELRPSGTWNDLPASWSIPAICELW